MNTQVNQEKRTIKVKEFLEDFRSGKSDDQLIEKYQLTQLGLDKFFSMLLERNLITEKDLEDHYSLTEPVTNENAIVAVESSAYICPCCLSSHKEMFDICPSCGVSFLELINKDKGEQSDFSAPQNDSSTMEHKKDEPKAESEVPMSDFIDKKVAISPADDHFLGDFDIHKEKSGFQDDEIIPGAALDYQPEEKEVIITCEYCSEEMKPGLRDIYDTGRSRTAFLIAGLSLIIGFLGALALAYLDNFSLVRLAFVFLTGISLLSVGIMTGIGSFMCLARERVYFCPNCSRIYPRG